MVPCPGLLAAIKDGSAEERLTGGSQDLFVYLFVFVLIHPVILVNTFHFLDLHFIFCKEGMTVLVLWDHSIPEEEKHTY